MEMQALVYHPLMEGEEEKKEGWNKETVEYVIDHKRHTMEIIRITARSISKGSICECDMEPLYSDLLMYLYQNADYNISKAINKENPCQILSLEGYISICIKFCIKKFVTDNYKKDKDTIRVYPVDSEGKESNPFESLQDEAANRSYEEIMCSLEDSCKQFEHCRYRYGADLYQLVYVRLLTINYNELYKVILELLGVSKKDIGVLERQSLREDIVASIAQAISVEGIEPSIDIVGKYVYSAQSIKSIALAHMA